METLLRIFSCLIFFSISLPGYSAEYIKIASFNIAEFGEGNHPETRDLDFMAKMLVEARLDLIAIQEVGVGEKGIEQVNNLVEEMNDEIDSDESRYYSYVTPQTGDEKYAFIYRSPVVLEDEVLWLDDDKEPSSPRQGGVNYYRIPVAVPFKAKNFDFYIVNMHLMWSRLERRTDEVKALKAFLKEKDPKEDDWIALGDMNRYGKYAKSAPDKAFDGLLKGNWKTRYRFPLLEAITNPHNMKISEAPEENQSTTIARSKNIYDQFIITEGAFAEFGKTTPVFNTDVGVLDFDNWDEFEDVGDHNTIKFTVSDHRPIWLKMRIDNEDDD